MNIYSILMSPHTRYNLLPTLKDIKCDKKDGSCKHRVHGSMDLRQGRNTRHKFEQQKKAALNLTTLSKQGKFPVHQLKKTVDGTQDQCKQIKEIKGYGLMSELGIGAFAEVFEVRWKDGTKYAMKQYNLGKAFGCFMNEGIVGEYFFEGGRIKGQFEREKGHRNIINFVDKFIVGKTGCIIQEIGGKRLSALLSELCGVFYKGERVYEVTFSSFYWDMAGQKTLKTIMLDITDGIGLLNRQGFIHCDLKPENILVRESENGQLLAQIIDFGSSFRLEKGLPNITITPEYMPPELLVALENDSQVPDLSKVDIWSIGCVLLEIVTGVPLWFRYKCKLQIQGKQTVHLGLFALTNRGYSKIVRRQKEICQSLDKIVFVSNAFEPYRQVLQKTLVISANKRASLDQLIREFKLIN